MKSHDYCENCENAIENLPETVSFIGLTSEQYLNVRIGLCMDCQHCNENQQEN